MRMREMDNANPRYPWVRRHAGSRLMSKPPPSVQQDVGVRQPSLRSRAKLEKIRLSEGVERHPIALAIPSGASAVLDQDREAI